MIQSSLIGMQQLARLVKQEHEYLQCTHVFAFHAKVDVVDVVQSCVQAALAGVHCKRRTLASTDATTGTAQGRE